MPDTHLASCTAVTSGSKVKVEANGVKAIFRNEDRREIGIVDVDCWLVGESGPRADKVVSNPGVIDVVVELKGKNIDHAVEQIQATCRRWKIASPTSGRLGGLIVFSRSPERTATIDDWKVRLLKQGVWLEMNKNSQTEYEFETFMGKKV